MKFLLIDAGNTTIDFRSYDDQSKTLIKLYRPQTNSLDQWKEKEIWQKLDWEKQDFKTIITTSVVPQFDEWIKKWGQKYQVPIQPIKTAKKIQPSDFSKVNFAKLGADLVTNFYARKWDDALIISLGTATTIAQIQKGIFQGVIIAPGIRKNLTTLIQSAALLKDAEFQWSEKAIGTNTIEAINLGAINGHYQMLVGFVDQLKSPQTKVIVTGGNADLIFPGLKKTGWEYAEALIFQGLINLIDEKKS